MITMRISINDPDAIEKCVSVLQTRGVIAYPTDTLYGLGADATSEESVREVIAIKGKREKPVSILVADMEMLKKYCIVTEKQEEEIKKILPGPYTVILQKREDMGLVPAITKTHKVGVRLPDHEFSRALAAKLGKPITSTSANKAGEAPPPSAEEINPEIEKLVDLVVDGGKCKYCKPSTVVDLTEEKPVILRRA